MHTFFIVITPYYNYIRYVNFIPQPTIYGEFNSVSITTHFNALFIAALIWQKGSTKMGKVSLAAQALSQVVS